MTKANGMPFVVVPIFEWNWKSDKPIVVNQGGTSSGKTYSILQVLFCKAAEKTNRIITVVGQDIPNLKKGAMRDFVRILDSAPFFRSFIKSYNSTDRIYTFNNGSIIEFTSYENEQDAKSGKRDYSFFNEANGISKEIFYQVQARTIEQTFLDYNPTMPFWVHLELIGKSNVDFFISNFTHNPFLHPNIKKTILSWKITDPERWLVYGRGKTGKVEGVIFKNVNWIDAMPTNLKRFSYGMDFGFSDPTVLIKCGVSDGELFAERWIYKPEMTTDDIDKELKRLGVSKKDFILADNANPKTIRELQNLGWMIIGAEKGADSIRFGISQIKKFQKLNIVHCEYWKLEQISYIWGKDPKTGLSTGEPIDKHNHLWDSLRYGIQGLNISTAGVTYS